MRSVLRGASVIVVLMLLLPGKSVFAGDELKVGDPAPDFTLQAATKDSILRNPVSLSGFRGKSNVILAFYPADWSGGCTKEMCTMRDNFSELGSLNATVLGISGDYVHSHREWASHLGLQFLLLSDHNHNVARTYSSYNDRSGYNLRTVFVVGKDGRIAYIDNVYVAGSEESFKRLSDALNSLR